MASRVARKVRAFKGELDSAGDLVLGIEALKVDVLEVAFGAANLELDQARVFSQHNVSVAYHVAALAVENFLWGAAVKHGVAFDGLGKRRRVQADGPRGLAAAPPPNFLCELAAAVY